MALYKVYTAKDFNDGNYWKLLTRRYDDMNGTVEVFVALFKDAAARNAGAEPMEIRQYLIQDETLSIGGIYNHIKNNDVDLNGATDV